MYLEGLRFFMMVELALAEKITSHECAELMVTCKYVETLMTLPLKLANSSNDAVEECTAYKKALECIDTHPLCGNVYANGMSAYKFMCSSPNVSAQHIMCLQKFNDQECKKNQHRSFLKWLEKMIIAQSFTPKSKQHLCSLTHYNCREQEARQSCGREAIEFDEDMGRKVFQGLWLFDCVNYPTQCPQTVCQIALIHVTHNLEPPLKVSEFDNS